MNLIDFIRENKDSRKIFGNREIKIIEKQFNGINLTQSEKNRLSRDIRKKFKFIQQVSRFENEFELKKGEFLKKIINETKEIILEDRLRKKIKKILLFGSSAKNERTFKSDIDLAVVFDKINKKDATLFRARIMGRTNNQADVQVFNTLPKKIKNSILEKNKIIYEDEQNKR